MIPRELAAELGISDQAIRNHCRRLGIVREYKAFELSERDAERIRTSVRNAKPGRPRKEARDDQER